MVSVLVGFLLSSIYDLLHHYKEKRQHIQQIALLLTTSASTAEGADIVAEQVRFLLESDPNIQSISFIQHLSLLGMSIDQEMIGRRLYLPIQSALTIL